jgi:hypothetical protein|tara:strand:- start:561 stop:980 length:420 start_codon:yes stop_codon:yes gene_type:complete
MRRHLIPFFALALTAALAACSESEAPQTGADASDSEAVTGSSPEPAPFYVGQWAADPVWCTDQSEGFPITITAAQFEGRENICEMAAIEATPRGRRDGATDLSVRRRNNRGTDHFRPGRRTDRHRLARPRHRGNAVFAL